MLKVIFVDSSGRRVCVEAKEGETLMQVAVARDINGILGQCGGACACATCHVYVDEDWIDRVGPPSSFESDMLENVLSKHPTSRLGCQIFLHPQLDGLVVHVPDSEY